MKSPAQLALDLPHRPAYGRDDLLVGPANAEAVAWLDAWPDWPGPGLAVHGPPACGKSHLAAAWRLAAAAADIDPRKLQPEGVPGLLGAARHAVVDPLLPGLHPAAERALLHLLNMVRERGGHVLVAATDAPARLACTLPDLASRLAALPAAAIGAPDDALLGGLLVKQFADRQLAVAPDVVEYLLRRIERSFAAAGAVVAAIDRESLRAGRRITIPLVARVLGDGPCTSHPDEGER